MRILFFAPLASVLTVGGCNDHKTDQLLALWGLQDDKAIFQTLDIHDANGSVAVHRSMTIAPTVIDDCRMGLTLGGTNLTAATDATEPVPISSWVIDYRKASTMTFEWAPDPDEAKLFTDPEHKPPFTPRKYLMTRITGDGAICLEDGTCPPTAGPFAFITDPTVTPEAMKAAFDRVKDKCHAT